MILDNKHFILVISISITAVTLILTLNIIGIFEEKLDINIESTMNQRLTGLAIENTEEENRQLLEEDPKENQENPKPKINESIQQEELYSQKSYFIYMLLIGILSFSAIALIVRLIFPKLKNLT